MTQPSASLPSEAWLADLEALDADQLRDRVRELAAALDEAHEREQRRQSQHALLDGLTGLGNRRDFVRQLDTLFSQHQRNDLPVSLILLDIVRFIHHHGEAAGERVLCAFADCLRETLRGMDMSFRIAEHEFAVVLPDTSLSGASAVADKLRLAAAYFLVEDASPSMKFDVSVGVAAFDVEDDEADAALQRAYEALELSRTVEVEPDDDAAN